jgi:hypothetical protein
MLSPGWLCVLIAGLRSGAGAPRFTLGTNPAPPFRGFTPALSSSQETTMEQQVHKLQTFAFVKTTQLEPCPYILVSCPSSTSRAPMAKRLSANLIPRASAWPRSDSRE